MGPVLSKNNKLELRVKLYEAIHKNTKEDARMLIKKGVDIDSQFFTGYTPLMTACLEDKLEILKLLLEYDADITTRTRFGLTIFHYAYMCENPEIISVLKEYRCHRKNTLKIKMGKITRQFKSL